VQEQHDFELHIWPEGQRYAAQVMASPAGRSERASLTKLTLVPNRQEADNLRLRLENAMLRSASAIRGRYSIEETLFREFGDAFFKDVFLDAGPVADTYKESLKKLGGDRRRLRVKLRIEAPELAQLPWEYLYNSRDSQWVGLQYRTPIIRFPTIGRTPAESAGDGPLNVLGMIANPTGYVGDGLATPLNTEKERGLIEQALGKLRAGNKVHLRWTAGETVEELVKVMGERRWDVFHFIGHGGASGGDDGQGGTKEGFIVLADELGGPREVPASELKDYLQGPDGRLPRLVVLNCCDGAREGRGSFTSPAATLVRSGISSVVAMQFPISDVAASSFAANFYESLAANAPVEEALTRTRLLIRGAKSLEWGTPVLYTDAVGAPLLPGVRPNGAGADAASDAAPAAPPPGAPRADGSEAALARRSLRRLYAMQ
jgi:hypothetical protein